VGTPSLRADLPTPASADPRNLIDVLRAAIELARRLAQSQGLRNAIFERADAQVHRHPPERFDLAISMFDRMFFTDPDPDPDPDGARSGAYARRFAAHPDDGVRLKSHAWIVTVRRR
jgi:hypothetical protein